MFDLADGPTYSHDYLQAVRDGLVPSKSMAAINGKNFILTGTSSVDVSDQGGTYEFLGAAGDNFTLSCSGQDNPTGTGTRVVLITMLDLDWNPVLIVMATAVGTTAIPGGPYLRAAAILGISSGDLHWNENDIDVSTVDTPAVHLRMSPTNNSAFPGCFAVPEGFNAEVINVAPFVGKADEVTFQPYLRQQGGNFVSGEPIPISEINADKFLYTPALITQKQDIIFRVQRLSGGGTLHFSIIIEILLTKVLPTANPV